MSRVLKRWLVPVAWLVPIGIFVQAVLAGRGWFVDPALFDVHGALGNALLPIAVAAAALIWISRVPRTTVLLASLTAFGMIGQIGLGYAGRRSGAVEASAAHVPLGVALLGLSVAVALLVSRHQTPDPDGPRGPSRSGPGEAKVN